jgi:hypothetical protein
MALNLVNIGAAPGDGTGDPARTAFDKLNGSLTEAYHGQLIAGRYYAPGSWVANQAGGQTNGGMSNAWMRASPFFLGQGHTFDRIQIEVTTAGSTGSVVRLGIYSSDPATQKPLNLLGDYGTVDCTTTGMKTIVINITLEPGLYWLTAVGQGSPTTVPNTRSKVGTDQMLWGTDMANYTGRNGYTRNAVPGAFPDPWTQGTYEVDNPTSAGLMYLLRIAP